MEEVAPRPTFFFPSFFPFQARLTPVAKTAHRTLLLIAFREDEGTQATTALPLLLATDRAEGAWENEAAARMVWFA